VVVVMVLFFVPRPPRIHKCWLIQKKNQRGKCKAAEQDRPVPRIETKKRAFAGPDIIWDMGLNRSVCFSDTPGLPRNVDQSGVDAAALGHRRSWLTTCSIPVPEAEPVIPSDVAAGVTRHRCRADADDPGADSRRRNRLADGQPAARSAVPSGT